MLLQAETRCLASVVVANRDQPLLPPFRQCRGFGANAMGVIAMRVMEHASLAKNSVYLIDLISTMERIDIGLWGKQQLPRSIGVLAQNCLATDYNNLLIPGDLCRRSDDVL